MKGKVAAAACAAFLALAVVFGKDLIVGNPPLDDIPPLPRESYDPTTVRRVRTEMAFNGVPCQSCHDGAEPLQGHPKEKGAFHDAIELKHGRNQHCFNCHHRSQPADFSNFDGTKIDLKDIVLLCARCHGTTYRDWKLGAHGKRRGAWAAANGGPKTTVCIACHDPHWPVFKPLEAAPAPHVNPRGPKEPVRHGEGGRG